MSQEYFVYDLSSAVPNTWLYKLSLRPSISPENNQNPESIPVSEQGVEMFVRIPELTAYLSEEFNNASQKRSQPVSLSFQDELLL